MSYAYQSQGFTVNGAAPSTGDEFYLNPGETKTIRFAIKNTGTTTWTNSGANPVKLGTANAHDRNCGFSNNGTATGWLSTSRIAMEESSVAQNATAHFSADFVGLPEASNYYQEYFTPVVEGVTWMSPDPSIYVIVDMRPIGTTIFTWYTKDGHHMQTGAAGAPANRRTDTPKLSGGSVVSVPDGPYSSMNADVAYRQLELIKAAGFNLVLLDWGGHGHITDDGCQAIIGAIRNNAVFHNMRYAFFVDNTPLSGNFDYLYSFTGDGYYAKLGGKPLLTCFGAAGASDSRFDIRSMGANDTGLSWQWECLPGGPGGVVQGIAGTVIPRFDDRVCAGVSGESFGKTGTQQFNKNLDTTLFADQFSTLKTAWNNRTIRYAFFNAWNEYHERQGPIEPHFDASIDGDTVNFNSNVNSNTYLYDITKGYIDQLRA